MRSTEHPSIFVLGDASNIPTSKAGSVAHFSVEVFVDNFVEHVHGQGMTHSFDGHANCFVESGGGKAMLLDFNYDTEPLTGTFPLPLLGPMTLLKQSRANHLGKARVPPHLLEPPAPRTASRTARADVDGGEGPRRLRLDQTQTRSAIMPTTTIAGHAVEVNDEGFLTRPDQWSDDLGTEARPPHRDRGRATTTGRLVHFLRDDFAHQGETATLRRVSTQTGTPIKSLFDLFPGKPAKKMAYVAGLPKPKGCV